MNRNSVQLLFLFLVFAIAAGCASRQVRSDYDPSVDFSQFETYNFFEDAGPRDSDYKSFFSQYMIAAISREMDARGYTKSDEPDLLINFNGVLQEKTRVSTSTVPSMDIGMGWGSYYGYRSGFYDPWFDGYETRTHVSEYTEGTFNIDLVDAKRKKLVWEVIGVSNVSQRDLADLEKSVNRGVAAYFAEYPIKVGGD